jgi:hypothetical protein
MELKQNPTVVRCFRATLAEDEVIRREAEKRGQSITAYLKSLVLGNVGRRKQKERSGGDA